MKRKVFIVSPAFDEEEGIPKFIEAIRELRDEVAKVSDLPIELILVDDGSTDDTYARIRAETGGKGAVSVTAVRLSRNYGHQAAIFAGLEVAFQKADERSLFVLLDSDLQHPPRLVPEILRHLAGGMDHVQMIRQDAMRGGWFKTLSSRMFYRTFRFFSDVDLPEGGSDFRGFSYRFLKAFFALPERGRFNRAIFCWLGFSTVLIPYEPDQRRYGRSKYSLPKMALLALNGISYFSSRPLIYLLGGTVAMSFLLCGANLVYEAVLYLRGHTFVMGWPTIVFLVTFWGGLLAVGQLLMAIYLSRVFDEVKRRPVHLIQDIVGPETSLSTEPERSRAVELGSSPLR